MLDRPARSVCLALCLVLSACGDNSSSPPSPDARIIEDSSVCSLGPQISRDELVAASVEYLRDVFEDPSGFDGGVVMYGESWVALGGGDCPKADWSALAYIAPIASSRLPVELRATHDRVAAVWALNGRRFVVFLPNDTLEWTTGRLPDNVVGTASASTSPSELTSLVDDVRDQYPRLTVDYHDQLGIVSLSTDLGTFTADSESGTRFGMIEAAADRLRSSAKFEAIEWSGLVFRIPRESYGNEIVSSDAVSPECLRVHTRDLLDQMTTAPSLASPLGPGPIPREPRCE